MRHTYQFWRAARNTDECSVLKNLLDVGDALPRAASISGKHAYSTHRAPVQHHEPGLTPAYAAWYDYACG